MKTETTETTETTITFSHPLPTGAVIMALLPGLLFWWVASSVAAFAGYLSVVLGL